MNAFLSPIAQLSRKNCFPEKARDKIMQQQMIFRDIPGERAENISHTQCIAYTNSAGGSENGSSI